MPYGIRLFTPQEGTGETPDLQSEIAKARAGKLTKDQKAGLNRIERGGRPSFGEIWALIATKGAAAPIIQEAAHNQIASLEGVIDEKTYPALFDIRSSLIANRASAEKARQEAADLQSAAAPKATFNKKKRTFFHILSDSLCRLSPKYDIVELDHFLHITVLVFPLFICGD